MGGKSLLKIEGKWKCVCFNLIYHAQRNIFIDVKSTHIFFFSWIAAIRSRSALTDNGHFNGNVLVKLT